jgi:predicted GIY-YIG superfamily endonuclease
MIITTNALNKNRILKAVREKCQVTYKGRPIRSTPEFSPETMKARSFWTDVIRTLREHKCQPRLLYPAKLSITIDGESKVFHNKTKLTHYISTNPALQMIITEKNQYKEGNHALEKARKKSLNKPKRRHPQEQNTKSNNKNNRKQQLLFLNTS